LKVWPMKAASVLFGCVSAADSAQEYEVCEDILQRNVVLITLFWQFWNPSSLYTTFDASKRIFSTR